MTARTLLTVLIAIAVLALPCLGKTITQGMQRQAVESYISRLAQTERVSYECAWLSQPKRIEVECSSAKLHVRLNSLKNGRLVVPMEVRCGQTRVKTIWHKLSCRVAKEVVVTTRSVKRGELITPDAVESKWVPIELTRSAVTDMKEAIGKKARYRIASGSVIKPRMLETPKPVEKGDPLVIVYNGDNLEISAVAIAQASGSPGNIIPVINVQSQRVFFARIIEHGKAEPLLQTGADDEGD